MPDKFSRVTARVHRPTSTELQLDCGHFYYTDPNDSARFADRVRCGTCNAAPVATPAERFDSDFLKIFGGN